MGLLSLFKSTLEKNAPESLADEYYRQSSRFYETACKELGPFAQPVEVCHRAFDLFLKMSSPKSLLAMCPPRPFHTAIAYYACLPHPECGEALSLFLFYREFSTMARRHPKFETRLGVLMEKIFIAEQAGDWKTLNRFFQAANPEYHVKTAFPTMNT